MRSAYAVCMTHRDTKAHIPDRTLLTEHFACPPSSKQSRAPGWLLQWLLSLPAGSSVPIFLPKLLSLRSAPSRQCRPRQCGPRQCGHGDHLGWCGVASTVAVPSSRHQAHSVFVLVMSTEWALPCRVRCWSVWLGPE